VGNVVDLQGNSDNAQHPDMPGNRHGHAVHPALPEAERHGADNPADQRAARDLPQQAKVQSGFRQERRQQCVGNGCGGRGKQYLQQDQLLFRPMGKLALPHSGDDTGESRDADRDFDYR